MGLNVRDMFVFFLSLLFVAATGIWALQGNLLGASLYVFMFLTAVLGLVATSFLTILRRWRGDVSAASPGATGGE